MKHILISILLFCSSAILALGLVVSYEEIQSSLFGSIQSIQTCCSWNDGEMLGEFRIIKVYYAGQDMLFNDITALSKVGSNLKVLHGFSFSEINNDHSEIRFESVSCKLPSKNVIKIEGTACNDHSAEKYDFSIVVDGQSKKYRFSDTIAY